MTSVSLEACEHLHGLVSPGEKHDAKLTGRDMTSPVLELQYGGSSGDAIAQSLQSGSKLFKPLLKPHRKAETHCQIINNPQKTNIKGLLTIRHSVT